MGISIWQLLIILAIVLVLFGAKRLRSLGSDLGASVKGFRDAMREGSQQPDADKKLEQSQGQVFETDTDKEAGRVFDAEVSKEKDKP